MEQIIITNTVLLKNPVPLNDLERFKEISKRFRMYNEYVELNSGDTICWEYVISNTGRQNLSYKLNSMWMSYSCIIPIYEGLKFMRSLALYRQVIHVTINFEALLMEKLDILSRLGEQIDDSSENIEFELRPHGNLYIVDRYRKKVDTLNYNECVRLSRLIFERIIKPYFKS